MENLNLEKFKNFETKGQLIFGGKVRSTTYGPNDEGCDTVDDANDNGTIDDGECVTIVEC